jgi:hypothetical protein
MSLKYVSYIFENQDVRSQVAANEALVELAANNIINHNIVVESYIYENLAQFVADASNVADVFESIRNFVISENTTLYSQLSEILADSELSVEEKACCLSEAVDPSQSSAADDTFHPAHPGFITKMKGWLPGHGTSQGHAGATITPNPISAADGSMAADPGALDRARSMAAEAAKTAQHKGAAALDFAKSQAHSLKDAALEHPMAAAAIGAGAAGLGAFGAYKAMKHRKG